MKNKKQAPVVPPREGPINPIGLFRADPLGSYTGRPMFPDDDVPVQDADDL